MTVYDLMTIMDKFSSLRAFVKVVELGSFSEAGRQLRLSRSAISKYPTFGLGAAWDWHLRAS